LPFRGLGPRGDHVDLQRPFEREYRALARDPGNWPALLAKVQAMELPQITCLAPASRLSM